jgi:hypothetical protein
MGVLPNDDDGRLLTGGAVTSIRNIYLNYRLPQFAKIGVPNGLLPNGKDIAFPGLIATTTTNSKGG